ncbi:MAG: hypothetical protein GY739_03255, partial [Mesoflavibacter sp.]|nr:hypothetical protein [Mesoflavibacter sp.]
NMVFNLNQGNGDRRLLRDWRHQCATTRPSVVPTDPNKRSGRNYINSLENDLSALENYYNARNGPKANKTKLRNIQQMNKYLEKQINNLKKIDKDASKIVMKKTPFEIFTHRKCKKLAKKLETHNNTDDDEEDNKNDDCKDEGDIILNDSAMVCFCLKKKKILNKNYI